MHVHEGEAATEVDAAWAERFESASVVVGTIAAVLGLGVAVAAVWFTAWGIGLTDVGGLPLAAAIDLVLLLLAVALHQLAADLGGW